MESKPCKIDGCPHEAITIKHGWCGPHHRAARRNGDPLDRRYLRGESDEVRFAAKVDKDGPVSEHDPALGPCWLWTGAVQADGYGIVAVGGGTGRSELAHRWSVQLHEGPIPDGMYVLHHCDNPPCVRPDHLYVGTQNENMQDASTRGRLRGRPTTLTEWDVRDIREMWANDLCTMNIGQIAEGYKVDRSTVSVILSGKTWKWVQPV